VSTATTVRHGDLVPIEALWSGRGSRYASAFEAFVALERRRQEWERAGILAYASGRQRINYPALLDLVEREAAAEGSRVRPLGLVEIDRLINGDGAPYQGQPNEALVMVGRMRRDLQAAGALVDFAGREWLHWSKFVAYMKSAYSNGGVFYTRIG
jgi:hypothetical protein